MSDRESPRDQAVELAVLRGERAALEHCFETFPTVFDADDLARLERVRREIAEREEVLPSWLRRR